MGSMKFRKNFDRAHAKAKQKPNGRESAGAEADSEPRPFSPIEGEEGEPPPPRVVCPTIFKGRTPPQRRWIVPQWVPYEVVTGLYGDGGVGKTLAAQQLQTGTALGSSWLGLPVDQVASLGVYCEDSEDELWRRQARSTYLWRRL